MTTTISRTTALPAVRVDPPEPSTGAATPAVRSNPALYVSGSALTLLATVLFGFVGHITLVSQLQYARTQTTAYADFRKELAEATAPTGQVNQQGKLIPMGAAVAVLKIPSQNLRMVVFEGTTSEVLRGGPGHRRDSVLPGQAGTSVILGRRDAYGAPFRHIGLLPSGAAITVITGQGEHLYRVLGARTTGDLVPPPLAAGKGRLTLVSGRGGPFAPVDIVRVDADLVETRIDGKVAPGTQPIGPHPLQVLPAAERPMASDPGAWVPLLLWGQGLLLASVGFTWLRARWGRRQAWVAGIPVLIIMGAELADQLVRLLPNLV